MEDTNSLFLKLKSELQITAYTVSIRQDNRWPWTFVSSSDLYLMNPMHDINDVINLNLRREEEDFIWKSDLASHCRWRFQTGRNMVAP